MTGQGTRLNGARIMAAENADKIASPVQGAQLEVAIGQASSAGVKKLNQDFHGALIPENRARQLKGIAAAIADGITPSPVSHIAAETAVKSFLLDYYCTSDAWSVKTAASRVIEATNAWLHSQSRFTEDANRAHVTTFSALVLKGRRGYIFHIGDSRIWRVAGSALECLTVDHRLKISDTETYLARALGLAPSVEIDFRDVPLAVGDILVLTTDGVHDYLSEARIAEVASAAANLDDAAAQLIDEALAAGSNDNLTIQILRLDHLGAPDMEGAVDEIGQLPIVSPPQPPCTIDGFRVIRQLHASNRSYIYLAETAETGKRVILKFPSVEVDGDRQFRQRFAMEEWAARRVRSPHVMSASDCNGPRSSLYLVFDWIDGITLRQWMRDNPKPGIATVRGILEQIGLGLQAFHSKDILHQDLRPENILIDGNGTVTLIDFGSVRIAGIAETMHTPDNTDILGTHQYSAPEYFLWQGGSERSDIFSLGVIAYEMLTGRLPYGARLARARTTKAQAAVSYAPARQFNEAVPGWLEHALCKSVAVQPTQRQAVVSEFIADLHRPRSDFRSGDWVPLMARDPLRFWRTLSLILLVALLTLGYHHFTGI